MNARIKQVRTALKMNQSEFGDKIGIGQAGISAIEKGIRGVTDRNIQLICEKFNVNENWLRDGTGEMFIEIPEEDEYFKAATLISKEEDKDAMDAIIKYWKLDPTSKKAIWDFIHSLAEK